MPLPTDSTHLTRLAPAEMVAAFTGAVESRFSALSIARGLWSPRMVTGTNSFFNRFFGKTELVGVTPGVRPPASSTPMTRRAVVIDTVVLARNNVDILNDVQADFSIPAEIALDQGKEHSEFFDATYFAQLCKGAQQGPLAGVDSIPGGKAETLGTGEEADPDAFAEAITAVLSRMRLESIPMQELTVYVTPPQYDVLLNNDKLVSRDFTAQGADFAFRSIRMISGCRLAETVAFPVATPAGQHNLLSNASNGYAYDVTAKDAKAVALIGHPKSLMSGESLSLAGDIWYNKEELQWFVDSRIAFGCTWNRPDVCGVVFKA